MALNLNYSTSLLNGHLSRLHHPHLRNGFEGMYSNSDCVSATILSGDCVGDEVVSVSANNDNNNSSSSARCHLSGVTRTPPPLSDEVRSGGGGGSGRQGCVVTGTSHDYPHHYHRRLLHFRPSSPCSSSSSSNPSVASICSPVLSPLTLSPLTFHNNGLLTYRGKRLNIVHRSNDQCVKRLLCAGCVASCFALNSN